jgi:MFS family permease
MNALDPQAASATLEQRRGMRNAIFAQSCGALGMLAFNNGLMLLYLTQQQFSSAQIMLFLAIPSVTQALTLLFFGYHADRKGLKRSVIAGSIVAGVGFGGITLSGFADGIAMTIVVALGILLFGLGVAMFSAGWFAILGPLVPKPMRGSFFGRMRLSWQFTGFLFGVVCTFVLSKDSPTATFQGIFMLVTAAMLARVVFIARMPELEKPSASADGFFASLAQISRAPGYASFCCYVFLITLSTSAAPNLFGLIEKNTLAFGDTTIVWMGNLFMIGAVGGFFIGGLAVDKLGTKPVFLIGHFSYALVLFGFLARDFQPLPVQVWLGALNFCFGMVAAFASIAISTEMLALIPPHNRSLSTCVCMALQLAGSGLSGMLSAGAIKMNLFSPRWEIAGSGLSGYDTMLLLFGVQVLVLVVALGLVPSVIGKVGYSGKVE